MTTTHFFVKYGTGDAAVLAICLLVACMSMMPSVSRRHRRITILGWLSCWLFVTIPVAAFALMRWQELHPIGTSGHVSRHSGLYIATPIAFGLWIASMVIMGLCWGAAGRERKRVEAWNSREPLREKARRAAAASSPELWKPEADKLFT